MRKTLLAATLATFTLLFSMSLLAVQVTIDPGEYAGQWQIETTASSRVNGRQIVDLDSGTHTIKLVGLDPSRLTFHVSENGVVTSDNVDAAVGGQSTLTFNNTLLTVDPGDYNGSWYIYQVTRHLTGQQQDIIVVPGLGYSMVVGGGGYYASRILFHVAADGVVTSGNTAAAVGGKNTLTFKNTSLTVDPVDYSGKWRIHRVTPYLKGLQEVIVVPGLNNSMIVAGESYYGAGINFRVTGDGVVTLDNADSAVGGQDTLTFKNTSLTVNPRDYSGKWYMPRVTPWLKGLQQSIIVVPGVKYSMLVGGAGHSKGKVYFHVAADEVVTSYNADAAVGGPNTLTFNNTPLTVDPVNYSGSWYLMGVAPYLTGLQQGIVVVPGLGYNMVVGSRSMTFRVAGDGVVTSDNADAAVGGLNQLTFNNAQISVSPIDFTGAWNIKGVTSFSVPGSYFYSPKTGTHSVILVPGLAYYVEDFTSGNHASATIAIANPCAVTPNEITFSSGKISLSCGEIDSDNDGTPDTSDNCPNVPNSDQKDTDGDNIGDVCDSDIDGDTVENAYDNCPLDSNSDQADNDWDQIGNVCDDDADGDSVPDTEDNCPLLTNIDQADNDADGSGDVCDLDDDNDTFWDDNDNCPLTSNIDQADYDGNGEGNACDGDIDGDNVNNANDLCMNTASNTAINGSGCNAAQFIELSCDRTSFANHGRYVSCVAKAANDAVNDGLLLEDKKSGFIKQAAKK